MIGKKAPTLECGGDFIQKRGSASQTLDKNKMPPLFEMGAFSFFVEEPVSLKKLKNL
jgi:hypothetical protein